MKSVLNYFNIYRNFVSCSLTEELSFRLNFFLLLVVDAIFTLSALGTTFILFDHIPALGNWNRDQLQFFLVFMLIIDDFQGLVLSSNFWMLSTDLKAGNLDFTFLKPVHSFLPMFFRYLRPSSVISLVIDIALLFYFADKLNFTYVDYIALPFLLFLSVCLRFILEMAIALLMFWTTEGVGINFIRLQLQSLSRWPDLIYRGIAKKVLMTLLPVLLVGSAPMHFLFDHTKWHYILWLIVAVVVFAFILHLSWEKARIRYESASS